MSNDPQTIERYAAADLITFATQLLARAGLTYAATVAEILVEADLMGHSTHGLNLLPAYLRELETGAMTKSGEPIIVNDTGAAVTWDGSYLPGPWLVTTAIDLAMERLAAHPVVTVAIRQSHHIACLATYLKRATDRGYLLLLAASDPREKAVAPYGGIQPLYSPNPIAAGIPTQGDPILIDISASTTANGVVSRYHQRGERLPHEWLLDTDGNVTDDPAVMFSTPRGSVLPLGGTDLGYKGFALGLLVEALTSALAGGGRTTEPDRWGSSVFLQMLNPAAFGGLDRFTAETEWLADASRNNPTKPGNPPVRLPGFRALQLRAEQLARGIALYPTILPNLQSWAEKLEVAPPAPIAF
jgi:LDH2 family malate/lactate/ureidoglycolate dehydrogenase